MMSGQQPPPPPPQNMHLSESNNESGGTSQSGLQSTPPHHRSQSNLLLDNGDGEYFNMDGIQYSVATGGDTGTYSIPEFFTCDDLYAVMDPTNTAGAVTEIDDASAWSGSTYIPLGGGTDRQSLQCSEGGGGNNAGSGVGELGTLGYSNGSFYRLLLHSDQTHAAQAALSAANYVGTDSNSVEPTTAGDNSNGSLTESSPNGNGDPLNGVTASPAAGVAMPIQELSATGLPVKIRKPRGRKPKHVKEAEAAAAAQQATSGATKGPQTTSGIAVASLTPTESSFVSDSPISALGNGQPRRSAPQRTGTVEDVPPNVVIHHTANNSTTQQQPLVGINKGVPVGPSQQQLSHSHKLLPQQQQPELQRQMSLEQMAYHDRRMIIMSRRGNPGPAGAATGYITRPPPPTYQQVYANHPTAGCSYRLSVPQNPGMQGVVAHNPNSGPPIAATSVIPSTPHPQYANPTPSNPSGRLDQFFSSRIAAPSNKAVLKPKLIQENRSIYNLLTTPTNSGPASPGFESRKLSQERWMQCPNPSILPDDNERGNGILGGSMDTLSGPGGNKPPSMAAHRRPCMDYSSAQPPNVAVDNTSRYVLGSMQGRVNIRRDGDAPSSITDSSGRNYNNYPQVRASSTSNHRTGNGYYYASQTQELQQRMEHLTNDNYELRVRCNYLNKMNKMLMARLRISYEQNEALKVCIHQTNEGGFGPMLSGSFGFDDALMMRGFSTNGGHTSVGVGTGSDEIFYETPPTTGGYSRAFRGGGDSHEAELSWRPKKMNHVVGQNIREGRLRLEEDALSTSVASRGGEEGGQENVRRDLKRSLHLLDSDCSSSLVTTKKACGNIKEGSPGKNHTVTYVSEVDKTSIDKEEELYHHSSHESNTSCGNSEGVVGSIDLDLSTMKADKMSEKSPVNSGSVEGHSFASPSGNSVETEPVMTDDRENTSSTLFNSPSGGGSQIGSGTSGTPFFQSSDFTSFTILSSMGVINKDNATTSFPNLGSDKATSNNNGIVISQEMENGTDQIIQESLNNGL